MNIIPLVGAAMALNASSASLAATMAASSHRRNRIDNSKTPELHDGGATDVQKKRKTVAKKGKWNAVLVTRGGKTTVLNNMTEEECRTVAQLNTEWGDPRPDGIRRAAERLAYGVSISGFGMRSRVCQDSDIAQSKYWKDGSDEQIDVWPQYENKDELIERAAAPHIEAVKNGTLLVHGTFSWENKEKGSVWFNGWGCSHNIYIERLNEDVREIVVKLADEAEKRPKEKAPKPIITHESPCFSQPKPTQALGGVELPILLGCLAFALVLVAILLS